MTRPVFCRTTGKPIPCGCLRCNPPIKEEPCSSTS